MRDIYKLIFKSGACPASPSLGGFVMPLMVFLLLAQSSAATVYLKPKEALNQFFQGSEKVIADQKVLTVTDKKVLKKKLGYDLARDSILFYIGKTKDQIDGYAVIENEVGKTQPITFMIHLDVSGKVKAIEVLVYRESHGSEVRHQRFLNQFKDKALANRFRPGQEIVNITGATLSVRAVSRGVKRALILWNHFYQPQT